MMLAVLALLACGNKCDEGTEEEPDGSCSAAQIDTDSDTDSGDSAVIDCEDIDLVLPTARGELGGAWDAARKRLIFFGGDQGTPVNCSSQTDFVGQTWAYDTTCDAFDELQPASAPPPRGRYAYAQNADSFFIHGGRFRDGTSGNYTLLDDLWRFDFATDSWTELPKGPSARTNHVMVVAGDRLVLYGGNTSRNGASFAPKGDTWSFDLATESWTELTTSNDYRPRLFHGASASADGSKLYVVGGGGANAFFGPFYRELLVLDLDTLAWSELWKDENPGPAGLIWPHIFTDEANDQLVVWAGHDDGVLGNGNQVWTWDLGAGGWSQRQAGDISNAGSNGFCDFPADFVDPDLAAPERRSADAAAWTGDGLITFGGKTDCGLINDVWSWAASDNTWTQRSVATTGEICLRAYQDCSTMCF